MPKKNAKAVLDKIVNYIDSDYKIIKDKEFIYVPLKRELVTNAEIMEMDFKRRKKQKKMEFKFLKDDDKKELIKSFDIVGTIAIIQIPIKLFDYQEKIGKEILQSTNVKTILKRDGNYHGEFRTIPLKYVAGENTKETIHTENGIKLKLDVQEVYYSTRSGNERLRIANKLSGRVLVMFSGCAPFPLVIEKHSIATHIVGIEKNPIAHKYALENKKINKSKIELINDDVKHVKIKEKFDYVIMPLPHSAEEFLDEALRFMKKGIIFIYLIRHENELEETKKDIIQKISWKGKIARIIEVVQAGDVGPGKYRYCMEVDVQ